MNDSSIIISEIELKLRKLIALKNHLAEQNEKLTRENEDLKNENERLRSNGAELQDKLNKNIIVNSLDNEKEIEESRAIIKSLVKEIDECVSIISNKK